MVPLQATAACCLALLLGCVQLLGDARAAMVLSNADAHLLKLLKPASRSALPGWMELHDRLSEEMHRIDQNDGVDVIFWGDSILESFRGESVGMPDDRYAANKEAWEQDAPRRAAIMAIAGDQAVHLVWRMRNGEGPQGINVNHMAIMIGTNDIAHLSSVFGYNASLIGHVISLGVQQCVRELQMQVPRATITVLGLLPLQPLMLHVPERRYDPLVAAANRELEDYVEQQQSPLLNYKDCGPGFLRGDGSIDYDLMPDGVHPSGPGAKVLLDCLLGAVNQ